MRKYLWTINDEKGNEIHSGIISAESQKSAREELIEKYNVDLSKHKVIVSSERLFKFDDNQTMWDAYFNSSLEAWNKENRVDLEAMVWIDEQKMKEAKKLTAYSLSLDKATPYNIAFIKKKQSLQQYKPIVLQFEEYVGKSFNEVTAKDVEEFRQVTDKPHRVNHLNAFFVYCVRVGVMKNTDVEFLINLLPDIYREVGWAIADLG
ncbi:MAG: hypothetical protein IJA10_10820 [Lachnospiraceae bacterium]|nr:hypothetical protein [Lachnospiraceae bacterium]